MPWRACGRKRSRSNAAAGRLTAAAVANPTITTLTAEVSAAMPHARGGAAPRDVDAAALGTAVVVVRLPRMKISWARPQLEGAGAKNGP